MTNLQNLILSIREQIPDRTEGEDPHLDGRAYSLSTLLRWINEAGDLICHNASVIQDWYAIRTVANQDVYELPDFITSVEQVFFNNMPLDRSSEMENLYIAKRSGNSWFFAPHSLHVIPKLFLFPAPSTSGATTLLNGALTGTATSATVDATALFNQYGFMGIDSEIIRYAAAGSSTTLTPLTRAQAGTVATTHADNAPVSDLNLVFKCFRLPRHAEDADAVLELPRGLHPLVELFVISKVLASEQDHQAAMQMRQEFMGMIEKLSSKPASQGIRQGIQVKLYPDGGMLSSQRVYIP